MGTVLFDFDSTLIPFESLERYAAERLTDRPQALAELEEITRLGMEGRIPFLESLGRRMRIVAPERVGLELLGKDLVAELDPQAAPLFATLGAQGHELRIVSGAFRELLLPAARALGLGEEQVHGVELRWTHTGTFAAFDEDRPFHRSKVEGLRTMDPDWPRPRIGVGDGMTDHALLPAGLIDIFVPYTGHVRRERIQALGLEEARSMEDLATRLPRLLGSA